VTSQTLTEILTDPARRPQAVATLSKLAESEVQSRSGISGIALKAGFKAVTSIKSDLVPRAIDKMLPEFAIELQPFWDARGGQPFGDYLAANSSQAADALLSVTDIRANNPEHAAIAKIYGGLRGKAKGMVEQALPSLGASIQSLAV